MDSYFVLLMHFATHDIKSTICKTKDELAEFISHLDTVKYKVTKIEVINEFTTERNQFLVKNKNLETGEKETLS
jgi:hypothetical protein